MTNKEVSIKYAQDVIDGVIPACRYVRLAAQRFLYDLVHPHYYFNDDEVDTVITFINTLYLTETRPKRNFILEPWQTFIIANLYGIYKKDNQRRKYKYGYIELARKNGKSQLLTALALYHLIFDEDAQVVVSANSREQAKNVDFKKVKQYAKQLDQDQKHLKQYYNAIKFEDSELLVTASEASKLDGLSVSFALIDELHEAPDNKMYNVIKSSMGARQEPLFLSITTAGFNRESFCYSLRTYCTDILQGIKKDESQFTIIYTIEDDDDFTDESIWLKANPNLSISVNQDFIVSEVNKAVNNESEKNGVLVKNFNIWTKNNTLDDWIPENYIVDAMREDVKISEERFDGCECYVGVDLANVSDITAVSYMIPLDNKLYFFNDYYLPEDSLNSNINREMFKEAALNNHIHLSQGNVTDYDYILMDMLKVNERNPILQVNYDKYNSTQWAIDATDAGLLLNPYSQVAGNLNKPIKELERLIKLGNHIIIEKNPITKWMFGNIILKINYMGNYNVDKSSKSKKIDGVASMVNCFGGYLENPNYGFNVW